MMANAIVYHIWARNTKQGAEGDTILAEFKAEQRDPSIAALRSTGLNSNDGTQIQKLYLRNKTKNLYKNKQHHMFLHSSPMLKYILWTLALTVQVLFKK